MSKKRSPKGFSASHTHSVAQQLQQIAALGQAGKLAEAASQCQQLLKQHPNQAQAWHLLSVISLQQGQFQQALTQIQRALELAPDHPDFQSQAGVIYCHLGDLEAGIAAYQRVLAQAGLDRQQTIHTRFNLGLALQKSARLTEAAQTYLDLIAVAPDYTIAYLHLGNLYQQQQRFLSAIDYYQQAIQRWTGQAQQQATRQYLATAWCNLGVALQAIERTQQAQAAFQQALDFNPDYAEAHNGLGAVYEKQQATLAVQHYQRALQLDPNYLPALINLGNVQLRLEQFAEAEAIYHQLLQLQPDNIAVSENCIKLWLTTCQWSNLAEATAKLQQLMRSRQSQNLPIELSPLSSLFLPLTAQQQMIIAQDYARRIEQRMNGLQNVRKSVGKQKQRIRLGYVSGDFRYHAVGQLILRLFELHDRNEFEVFAYCLSPDDQSRERQKLRQDCDYFRVLRQQAPEQMAKQIREDEIDILIDLAGYTNYACPELFALRPAPIQVNYLGYPATLGATYIDYIITDAVITPPELAETLTETCLYLPETYQINCYPYPEDSDNQKPAKSSKIQNGLPADSFVFCCFNKCQKIEPIIFAVWMRILQQVPDSVLWLLSDHPAAEQNLRLSAAAQGIEPDRLIFAPRVHKSVHLSRHQFADLFLDTLYYNAHVTASDSLWAGTPLITVLGNTFASRVAASLLTAAGIPELIAPNLSVYEQLAIRLATHPAELQKLKTRLLKQRAYSPLFNTERTVRHLEAAYRQIWQHHQSGQSPQPLQVTPLKVTPLSNSSPSPLVAAIPNSPTPMPTATLREQLPDSPTPSLLHSPTSCETLSCTADRGFLTWLSQSNGSLLITTYQAGKVLLVGWNGEQVTLLARQFTKPMGVALAGDRLALSTRHELIWFANARSLAPSYLEAQPNRYDALYLPRAAYYTGDLHTHDLAFGKDGLWLVNTRFSCLASLSLDFSFVPRWYPAFISELTPEDRCHLNGLAMVDGKPKYVTALGETNTVGGWRTDKATGGIVIDVETDQIVLRGLSMPHSPRWYQDKLWLLNSGTGELWRIDPANWQPEVVCALPGFGRGLTLVGNYALVGLCQMREQHIFGGLPLQARFEQLICGVAIVDLRQGELVGLLEFPTGCRELYDIKFLPQILQPNLLDADKPAVREGFTAPEFAYWLRPSALVQNPAEELNLSSR